MTQEQKQLAAIILHMIKDIYKRTAELEKMFHSNSIHILSRHFDPFSEMLKVLRIPEDQFPLLLDLMNHYIEDEMTSDELLLEMERHMNSIPSK
ncbi:hypothetical protein [Lihuaxuella thermophila]|uniref:Uncharacterized protein n=1 Tax=Lihuaxuella thermophila TaxID=1173111 RepID=A0A1H8IQF0_9BACL|nr:hypothetical protein [Lihuaxuella thermophila]SEN71130.1 hypothetical protein SAMN05444955_11916 [Lihuaxuella thermophila]